MSNNTCLHFVASSEGSIYLVFADVPSDYKTYFYIRVDKYGIEFYKAMLLVKEYKKIGVGSLGSATLYESYFVCIRQNQGNFRIQYGKSSPTSISGEVKSTMVFPGTENSHVSFYSFAAGESEVDINDVKVLTTVPELRCTEKGTIKVEGDCVMKCHSECNGCFNPLDAKSCNSCMNYTNELTGTVSECVSQCPAGTKPSDDPKSKRCQSIKSETNTTTNTTTTTTDTTAVGDT